MRTFFFTEMPYPYVPPLEEIESLRVSLPNSVFDPKIGAALYNRYLDFHVMCDELGLDVMINEHHQTATCLQSAGTVTLSALARQTSRARLLFLGNPIVTRNDPVRVAEEMAMVDNISYGRLECGFVHGVPTEHAAANVSAVDLRQRFEEAQELILKAFTTHDGPFNWEGKHFQYRQVNIWPRPYQQPHPPIWVATGSEQGVVPVARNGHVAALLTLQGWQKIKGVIDKYRETAVEHGAYSAVEEVPHDRIAILVLAYVGDTDREGLDGAEEVCWYLRSQKSAPQWSSPPGYVSLEAVAGAMKTRTQDAASAIANAPAETTPASRVTPSVAELIDSGALCAGNPEAVYRQIKRLYDNVGGFANLIVMAHSGRMSAEMTTGSIDRFAKEVQPRLAELP